MSTRKRRADVNPRVTTEPATRKINAFLERRSLPLAVALVALGSLRIVSTYTVFNHTSDEPAHIACGMEWLDKHVYRWEPQHPPLARVTTALGPYLSGIRSQNTPRNAFLAMSKEGCSILYSGHHYDRTLALARLGILPFFWIACAAVYGWGKRYFGPAVAATAVFLFSFLPPVLAHSGLATTDMALTAMMAVAFVTGMVWIEHPTWRNGALFGAAGGLMVLAKLSSLPYFPVSAGLALAWYWYHQRPGWKALRARVPSLAVASAAGVLVIWAGYRFSFGDSGIAHLRLPAPELFAGIRQVWEHNALGHDSYLLGARSRTGFWPFYLVGLAVKTPLAFLALLGAGIAMLFRPHPRRGAMRTALAFSAGVLAVAMGSRINIGIRHILPVYLGFSLLAAVALLAWLERSAGRRAFATALGVLVLWVAASSLLAHPDYLPYFNELAGSEPEKILVDSDLDWGQDYKRLAARLHEVGATDVAFDKYIVGDWEKEHGFPHIHQMDRDRPSVGWNAIGVGLWKITRLVVWPDRIPPQERVGKTMLLWYFPPAPRQALSAEPAALARPYSGKTRDGTQISEARSPQSRAVRKQ